MHDTGEYSVSDLAELFSVSRPTVYRTLNRRKIPWSVILHSAGTDPFIGSASAVSVSETPKVSVKTQNFSPSLTIEEIQLDEY